MCVLGYSLWVQHNKLLDTVSVSFSIQSGPVGVCCFPRYESFDLFSVSQVSSKLSRLRAFLLFDRIHSVPPLRPEENDWLRPRCTETRKQLPRGDPSLLQVSHLMFALISLCVVWVLKEQKKHQPRPPSLLGNGSSNNFRVEILPLFNYSWYFWTAEHTKHEYVMVVPYLHINMFIYHPVNVLKTVTTQLWWLKHTYIWALNCFC